ncbi:MAG: hypothetical protein KC545_16030, partial [Nitrospira sp.]|nr:hypothetical protein [Nitrospira sp.]
RAGQFNVNSNGNLVNPAGLTLQGFQADANGNILGTVGDLVLTTTQQTGVATTEVEMSGNLDASESVVSFTTAQLLADPSNPAISQFSTGIRVFDSLGVGHDFTLYFSKTAANTWTYSVLGNASEVTVTAGNSNSTTGNALVAQGTLGFTTAGLLNSEGTTTYFNTGATGIDFSNGSVAAQAIAFDFGTSITTDSGSGTDGMLQQGANSVILTLGQDGFANGTLT